MRLLRLFCKDFSNDYTFPTSWIRLTPSPVLEIIQLHDDVVSRDKIIFRRRNFKQKKTVIRTFTLFL